MAIQYTAITIGPIYNTMLFTSSPGGLWCASGLFSWIARELLQSLVHQGVPVDAFVTPYFRIAGVNQAVVLYDSNDEEDQKSYGICEDMRQKGVGLFHDRIIFRSEGVEDPLGKVNAAAESVISQLAENLKSSAPKGEPTEKRKKWLRGYLKIYALRETIPDNESPILYLGSHLSTLELEPNFITRERENPLLRLFENASFGDRDNTAAGERHNELLKNSFLTPKPQSNWILNSTNKKKSIRDLQDIASLGVDPPQRKYQQYYAVLKSDGDSMGEMLKTLTKKDDIWAYSRKCLLFCAQAAKQILDYGGMPIYAGGDDLLAILPVVGNLNRSIFWLVEQLRTLFNTSFQAARSLHGGKPTISFGIAVQYVRSPLYEALERADDMLISAKSGEKNACYLNLQKHSGKAMLLAEEKMDQPEKNLYASLDDLFTKTQKSAVPNVPQEPPEVKNSEGEREQNATVAFLSGAGYQVERFKPLFFQAICDPEHRGIILENLFHNLFDHADQKKFAPYLDQIRDCTLLILEETRPMPDEEDAQYQERVMGLVQSAIRMIHFMNEKADRKEAAE